MRQQKYMPSASSVVSLRRTSTECSAWRCDLQRSSYCLSWRDACGLNLSLKGVNINACIAQELAYVIQDLWETREMPRPLQLAEIIADEAPALQNGSVKEHEHTPPSVESACKALGIAGVHRVWSLAECAKVAA